MRSFVNALLQKFKSEEFHLNEGATELALDRLFSEFGTNIPETYIEYIQRFNGQSPSCYNGIILGFGALSIEDTIKYASILREVKLSTESDYEVDQWTSYPQQAIAKTVYSLGWMPVAEDASGNYIGIDFSPDVAGTIGQLIYFGRDVEHTIVLSPSLAHLERWTIDALTDNRVTVTPDGVLFRTKSEDSEELDLSNSKLFTHIYDEIRNCSHPYRIDLAS